LKKYIQQFVCSAALLLFVFTGFAQVISLDSVAKIEIIGRGYILSRQFLKHEVVLVNGTWKCYQTELHDDWGRKKDNLNKVFIKDVSVNEISKLINTVMRVDTGLHTNMFNINSNELVHDIDSLYQKLKPKQLQELKKAAYDKALISKGIYNALHNQRLMDDLSHLYIVITAKSGCKIIAHARDYYLYSFPWDIDGVKSYDPNIVLLFYKLIGDTSFAAKENHRMHKALAQNLYVDFFEAKFSFDDLRLEHPTTLKNLGSTLVPKRYHISYNNSIGKFTSKLLPASISMDIYFKTDDATSAASAKQFEDSVAQIYKNNNFLFKYLKAHPECRMNFSQGSYRGMKITAYRTVETQFPAIANFDYDKIKLLEIFGSGEAESRWLLLPDNTALLYWFKGAAYTDDNRIKLLNISKAIADRPHGNYNNSACIVFNAEGKVIHNYGIPPW
jgi:hypothetical protein